MKKREKTGKKNVRGNRQGKSQERKERYSLTLLYSCVIFATLIVGLIIAAVLSNLAARLGVVTGSGEPAESTRSLLLFMILVSVVVGMIFAVLTRRIFLNPFNRLINNMNRLAAGDFKARLTFGKPIRKIPAFSEISDSFNTMAQELEDTEILRSDFINDFSHEFKTPIVSIVGFAKLLKRGNLTEDQKREYIDIIEEESVRLANMASNILNLTRVESRTILTDAENYNLSEQVRDSVLLLEEMWMRREIEVELDFEEYQICGNKELLKQVWLNLIDNALKFTAPGGTVRLKIAEREEGLEVSVTNFGIEIPPEERERIFQKFYQIDRSRATEGTGVGLAVVKSIVDLHGGTVRVESAKEVTTFTVFLPKEK